MKQLLSILILLLMPVAICIADDSVPDGRFSIVTECTYRMGDGDSRELARALTLFGAKMKAVSLAAKYFTHKGALGHYEKRQNEIFHLVPRQIASVVIDETWDARAGTCFVKILSEISSVDFIRAEIEDAALQKAEEGFSFDREMTQPVEGQIEPGRELSRAYRYIRKEEWRIAIIYLDHLEKKYANWGEIFLAKAIALYGAGDDVGMLDALADACHLENQEACDELASFNATDR